MKPPTKYLAEIGRKGGSAKGPAKRRGDSEYYRSMQAKRKDRQK